MIRDRTIQFQGGLDLVTSPVAIREGASIGALNYESEVRGYKRSIGYERLDGQPKPSEAQYWLLGFTAGTTEVSEGDTITGATSGATAIALIDGILSSGTYASSDAAGSLVLYNLTGDFVDGEALQVSASTVATSSGVVTISGASNDEDDKTYRLTAIAKRRAVIQAVPGSGPVRGVFTYKGDIFAVRDNVGATAGVMHKATTAGWVEQTFGNNLFFDNGTVEIVEGDTLTGGTSGATATVERVILQTGDWNGAGDAEGYMVLSGVVGAFQDNEAITSGGGAATANGADAAITLPSGGKYRVREHNFFGASNLRRAYMVNGVGRALEWDGSVLAPIITGTPDPLDTPKFIGIIGEHLVLGFDGGSLQGSGTGLPLRFSAVTGAFELGLGEDITGIKSATKTTTIITGRNKVSYIAGTSSADFQLLDVSEDSGAVENTLEVVGTPLFLDDIGVRDMRAADTFGNWRIGTTTSLIEPLIRKKRQSGLTPVGTLRVRSRDIYRLFYSDGSGISIYFGRKNPECFPLQLGFTPSAFYSGEDADGYEILLAGDDQGFVYQMDAGTSFDGAIIPAYNRLAHIHLGSPNANKRFPNAVLEVDSEGFTTSVAVSADTSYGDPNKPIGREINLDLFGSGGSWNDVEWNRFQWSARTQPSVPIDLNAIGTNISLTFMSDQSDEEAHTLASLVLYYSQRKTQRFGT